MVHKLFNLLADKYRDDDNNFAIQSNIHSRVLNQEGLDNNRDTITYRFRGPNLRIQMFGNGSELFVHQGVRL